MNKYFSRGSSLIFVIAVVFIFSAFINVTPARATSLTFCQTIESLIKDAAVTLEKANAARAAAGCPISPILSTSTPQTAPVGTIIGTPDLRLVYDSNNTILAKAHFTVSVTAIGDDVNLPMDPFVVGLIDSKGNGGNVRSSRTISISQISLQKEIINGSEYYIIPEGETVHFEVSYTVDTNQLFAGSYFARLYGNWNSLLQKSVEIVPSLNSTNKLTIVGEKAPYITSITSPIKVGELFTIKGTRISENGTTNRVYIDGNAIKVDGSKGNGSTFFGFSLPYLSSGNHYVELSNQNGMSNKAGFNVEDSGTIFQPGCPLVLTRDLIVGSSGADVTALQNFLGVTPATGYFGAVLKAAVIAYQKASGISPADGKVGAKTRAFIAKKDICGTLVSSMSGDWNQTFKWSGGTNAYKTTFSQSYNEPAKYTGTAVGKIKYNVTGAVNGTSIKETWVNGNYKAYVSATLSPDGSSYHGTFTDTSGTKGGTFVGTRVVTSPEVSSITVLSPNGGESLVAGNNIKISWNVTGDNMRTALQLLSEDGNIYNEVTVKSVSGYNKSDALTTDPGFRGLYIIRACLLSEKELTGFETCDASDSYFKIVDPVVSNNQPPVINGVTAPTSLRVGEKGTWSVSAYDPENGSLSYGIDWGDNATVNKAVSAVTASSAQTSTFTHSYSAPGNYTVTISVQDNTGLKAGTSVTVDVTDDTTVPVIITPVIPTWTYCATENAYCKFSGSREVRYGANSSFYYKTLVGGTLCGNSVFGDPVKQVKKSCYIRNVQPTTPIPTTSTTSNSATVLVGWESFIRLVQALR